MTKKGLMGRKAADNNKITPIAKPIPDRMAADVGAGVPFLDLFGSPQFGQRARWREYFSPQEIQAIFLLLVAKLLCPIR
jgi:hypothetical protein